MADARTQTVTVVFTDVVGSTAWRVRIGDRLADARTAELARASCQVVESAGGTVVKSLGDGVMATFMSAVAGLEAAAALQAVARRLAVGNGELGLRVGVSTGDMVRDGDDWLGAAAIEASRLCAEAVGGAVLVADATVRLSRGRSNCVLRPVGERLLRGFDVPVEVYELATDRSGEMSLPPALVLAADAPLVGRTVELARARSALEAVAEGGCLTLFVVGEPGVGKTRLAGALATEAMSRGFTVLHGRCDESLAAPYQPVIEAIGPWLAAVPDAALLRIVGDDGVLASMWPELASRSGVDASGGGEEPEARRWRLFEAVAGLVASIAGERPLLLVVDDLQWAEASTLLLLAHLVRRAIPGLVIVATVRRGERAADVGELLGDIGTDRAVMTIDLGGLDQHAVAELVALETDELPPDDLSAELHAYTNGNPFLLATLLAHLEEVAFVRSPQGVWATTAELTSAGVPHGARSVINRRLRRLGSAADQVLAAGAVAGLVFDSRVIRGVLNVVMDEILDVLDAALAADLLHEERPGRYAFAHALVRQAVLDDLSRTRLATLHWRIAEQLEREDRARLGEIAHHYASGREIGDDATVVRTSLAAGEDALQRVAFDEAARHLRTALDILAEMPHDADLRYRVLASLGQALNALGEPIEAQKRWLEAADIARSARNPERMFETIQGYGYISRLTADAELVRLLDDLLEVLGPSDSALRASALGWRAGPAPLDLRWLESSVRMVDDAVAMARRTGQTDAVISTLHSRLLLELQSPDAQAMLSDAQEVVATLERSGSTKWDRSFSRSFLVLGLLRLGRRADADEQLEVVASEAAQNGLRLANQRALLFRSALATASGRFADGKALAAEAVQRAGSQIFVAQLSYAAQILGARLEQGRLDSVIAGLATLDSLGVDLPGYRAMRGGALAQAGHTAEATEEFDRLVAELSRGEIDSFSGTASMLIRHLTETCRQLNDSARATTLLPFITPWAGQILVGGFGLSIEGASDRAIAHILATAGRLNEAASAYEAAAEFERSAGFPPFVARSEYWHAQTLLERGATGDRSAARALLDDVIDITDRLGMTLLHHQADSLRNQVHQSRRHSPSPSHGANQGQLREHARASSDAPSAINPESSRPGPNTSRTSFARSAAARFVMPHRNRVRVEKTN